MTESGSLASSSGHQQRHSCLRERDGQWKIYSLDSAGVAGKDGGSARHAADVR